MAPACHVCLDDEESSRKNGKSAPLMQKVRIAQTMVLRLATEADIWRLGQLYWDFHLFHVLGVADRLGLPALSDGAKESTRLEAGLRTIIQREDAALFVVEMEAPIVGFAEVY